MAYVRQHNVLDFRDIHSRKAAAMTRTPDLELELELEQTAGRAEPQLEMARMPNLTPRQQAQLELEQAAGRRAVEAAKNAAARSD